ncbi:GreA/GreB family elongation factor [Flavobacterium luminosum]|uniref:GreA/GreB family elongation factor n=1 Tax=Flavobacterium luminosum TaxID=2949086 RepID=A0ABT0TMY3_9FLAO|nr:hypothetical protein [Flavobacterium sp. HXWNR70]MCL9808853.1 hypothetical protein [Flavobacterium sp. HXWNR70]
MSLKKNIHQLYLQILQDKIDVFQDMITSLAEDSLNDAKGSAGDKHETALSMMHLEQEKLSAKLRETLEYKTVLDQIDTSVIHTKVTLGSLVKTNHLTVYIAAALPKIDVEGQNVFGISAQSPLGISLLGKETGYSFQLNNVNYQILSVE